MNESKLQQLYNKMCFTSVFIGVMQKPLLKAFSTFVCAKENEEKRRAYAAFVSLVYENGGSLTKLLQQEIAEDENVYIKSAARGEKVPTCMEKAIKTGGFRFGNGGFGNGNPRV